MRYGPGHNEATRERIVGVASKLFREDGIAAVGLAKIMSEADLTVGTFYTHFKSKEALIRATLLVAVRAQHEDHAEALRGGQLEVAVRAYLSPSHRDASGTGCPTAALVAEVARQPPGIRQTLTAENAHCLDLLAQCLSARRGKAVSRSEATAYFGLLAGTLQLARATPDRAESDAILEAGIRTAMKLAT